MEETGAGNDTRAGMMVMIPGITPGMTLMKIMIRSQKLMRMTIPEVVAV